MTVLEVHYRVILRSIVALYFVFLLCFIFNIVCWYVGFILISKHVAYIVLVFWTVFAWVIHIVISSLFYIWFIRYLFVSELHLSVIVILCWFYCLVVYINYSSVISVTIIHWIVVAKWQTCLSVSEVIFDVYSFALN